MEIKKLHMKEGSNKMSNSTKEISNKELGKQLVRNLHGQCRSDIKHGADAVADKIFNAMLEKSDLPRSLFSNVKTMINNTDFVKDGVLDKGCFINAVKVEIAFFEESVYKIKKGTGVDLNLGRRLAERFNT